MLTQIYKKSISCFLIVSFLLMLLFSPTYSYAKWHKKGDLPGGISNSEMLTYALLAVGAVFVIYLIQKSSEPKKRPEINTDGPMEKEAESDSTSTSLLNRGFQNSFKLINNNYELTSNKTEISVFPILGVKNNPNANPALKSSNNGFSDQIFVVGLAVNF